jgi:calcineurin-like phosphoesterase family protein
MILTMVYTIEQSRKVFFTADTHFGHARIIELCNRGFRTVDEMDETMIKRWNDEVPKNGIVYHLGDFSMGKHPASRYLDQLNGKIHLIAGNHDEKALRCKDRFASISDLCQIEIETHRAPGEKMKKQKIVMCHYPMRVWDQSHRGSWQLFGHVHGQLPQTPKIFNCDVGVDVWDFRPISAATLFFTMGGRVIKECPDGKYNFV